MRSAGVEPGQYTLVEVLEEEGGLRFSLRSETGPDGRNWVHEIPLQAVAERMELLGLETPEEALEVITETARAPELADEIYESLHEAYGEVVRSEARALYASDGQLTRQTTGSQTAFAVGLVSEPAREKLERVRREALDRLGLGPVGARTLAATAGPGAGTVAEGFAARAEEGGEDEEAEEGPEGGEDEPLALRPSPQVTRRVCEIVRDRAEEVEALRMFTAVSHLGVWDAPAPK